MTYVHRLIWTHAEHITQPRRSCLDTPEYPVVLALRKLFPGDRLTFGVVTVYRMALMHQKGSRYTVSRGTDVITVTGESVAAKWVCEWQD